MRRTLTISAIVLFAVVSVIPISMYFSTRGAIYLSVDDVPEAPVAVVFGAGLRRDGKPSDVLRDRLTVAAGLYKSGKAKRVLVSGDNRFHDYNEPQAMNDALVEDFGVPAEAIAIDYAGRRTYDTCTRAKTLWGVNEAILVSQGFHLPRAIWTCERLGVKSVGVSASLQSYVKRKSFAMREIPAIMRAWWDIYIVTPKFMAGEFEEDLAP